MKTSKFFSLFIIFLLVLPFALAVANPDYGTNDAAIYSAGEYGFGNAPAAVASTSTSADSSGGSSTGSSGTSTVSAVYTTQAELKVTDTVTSSVTDFKYTLEGCSQSTCKIEVKEVSTDVLPAQLKDFVAGKNGEVLGATNMVCTSGSVNTAKVSYSISGASCDEIAAVVQHDSGAVESASMSSCTSTATGITATSTFSGCSYFAVYKVVAKAAIQPSAEQPTAETTTEAQTGGKAWMWIVVALVVLVALAFLLIRSRKNHWKSNFK
jgi:LPXTG-motif cell wall-anchored protein